MPGCSRTGCGEFAVPGSTAALAAMRFPLAARPVVPRAAPAARAQRFNLEFTPRAGRVMTKVHVAFLPVTQAISEREQLMADIAVTGEIEDQDRFRMQDSCGSALACWWG